MRRMPSVFVLVFLCLLPSLLAGRAARARTQDANAVHSLNPAGEQISAAGTLVLRGSLASTATITFTGAFSVGQATNLSWDLPVPTSISTDGYAETVSSVAFTFNTAPDSQSDLPVGPNIVRRFRWASPPPNATLTVLETVHLRTTARLNAFHSGATYPLPTDAVPASVAPYLQATRLTLLPSAGQRLARALARGASESVIVTRIADWIAQHIRYVDTGPADAPAVLAHHTAGTAGYSDTMAAMLRFLGIPVRFEFGWLSAAPLYFPEPPGVRSLPVWSLPRNRSQAHGWILVYFPDAGWVPFDPEAEKFFVDTRHFALFSNLDAGDPVDGNGASWFGRWSADAGSGGSVTGKPLANGQTEIVPGDGAASKARIVSMDSFHVRLAAYRRDVRRVQLYAR